ncbi:chromosome segregation protein Spc25-domain-containing protein [Kalaharituber pfeilii]|nr:chromosome segregation protein Spc25-domain-containing protein [Kalaharituber pfeilii]
MPATNVPLSMQLPVVNFGFDELREQMNRFTMRFDEFIEKGRKRLLLEKNEFARTMAEDKESAREMRGQIDYYREKEREVQEQSKREQEEAHEAELTIASMARKKTSKADYRSTLLTQISTLEANIANLRSRRAKERSSLALLSSQNAPELAFWEDNLGMRIEGAGVEDHLKIVFTCIADNDWDKEFSFVVTMETREYRVIQCRPRLDEMWVKGVVDRLNGSRNFAGFLKEMRGGFVELARGGNLK